MNMTMKIYGYDDDDDDHSWAIRRHKNISHEHTNFLLLFIVMTIANMMNMMMIMMMNVIRCR